MVLTKLFFQFEQQELLQLPCRLSVQQLSFPLVEHFGTDIADMSIYGAEPYDSENCVQIVLEPISRRSCYHPAFKGNLSSILLTCTNGACCGTTVEACRGVNGC